MEVVRSNFDIVLPQVEQVIKESVLIAIDTEFTGLSTTVEDERSLFDSIDVRYNKIRRTVRSFTICQFGLCGFIKDEHKNMYIAHSFNFYLFPTEVSSEFNPRILIQTSNMEFLCQHKFDFNKWIYEGISYCNEREEASLCEIEEKEKSECIGFRKIFQLLVKSKKPLMGHNMLLDLAYMIEKFHKPLPDSYLQFKQIVHSLFPTIIDTKTICFNLRKKLDQSSCSSLLDKTSLGDLYIALGSQKYIYSTLYAPEVVHSKDCLARYSRDQRYHEAGFDAYCVGYVFLRMVHLLAMKEIKARPVHFKQYLRMVASDTNKVNVIQGPLNCINFAGPDDPPKKLNVLLVKTVDGDAISLQNLKELLSENDIQLLSKDSALVALPFKNRETQIIERLKQHSIMYQVEQYNVKNGSFLTWCKNALPYYAGTIISLSVACYIARYMYYHYS